MDRRTLATAALALLAVLALGVAAATLDSATTSASGGVGAGSVSDESGVGDGENGPVDLGGDAGSFGLPIEERSGQLCYPVLTDPRLLAGIAVGVVGYLLAIRRTTRSWTISGLFVGASLVPPGILYAAFALCPSPDGDGDDGLSFPAVDSLPGGGGSAGADAAGEALSTPTALAGLLLLVAIAGSVLLLFVSTGDDEESLADEPPEPPAPERRREVGRVAGDAADRLESDADLANEVYRAWRGMTAALAVDSPRSTTPAEFADAAVEAGMAREDVTALTETFETVRYGGEPATPEREAAAIEALRRIEAGYTGDGADGIADLDAPDGSGDADRMDEAGDIDRMDGASDVDEMGAADADGTDGADDADAPDDTDDTDGTGDAGGPGGPR
ncbi:DUF4129 domain-containing protein [Halobacteriales archaeon QS_6_71_20]|nr:MAG: DUF4129 domain-containing protein [Halobacteriales archaeon QS_6_71_20]